MGIESDKLVYDYLGQVGDLARSSGLPSSDRVRLVTELRVDIDRRRAGGAATARRPCDASSPGWAARPRWSRRRAARSVRAARRARTLRTRRGRVPGPGRHMAVDDTEEGRGRRAARAPRRTGRSPPATGWPGSPSAPG
ncbi:hypothetical protein NKH77_23985 [Streptomyces sp. M19]